jgi:hypothetical protein
METIISGSNWGATQMHLFGLGLRTIFDTNVFPVAFVPDLLFSGPEPTLDEPCRPHTVPRTLGRTQRSYERDPLPCAGSELGDHEQRYVFTDKSFSGTPHLGTSSPSNGADEISINARFTPEDLDGVYTRVKQEPVTFDMTSVLFDSPGNSSHPGIISARVMSVSEGPGEAALDGSSDDQWHGLNTERSMATLDQTARDMSSGRRFACYMCNKQFTLKSHLQRHMVVHTGEKTYRCEVCSYSCNRKENLKRHTALHMGGSQDHQCHLCAKEFAQKCNLKAHLLTHWPGL